MKQTTSKWPRSLLVLVIPLLMVSLGFSASIPMDDSKELTYVIPEGWHHQRTGGDVQISTPGIKLKFTRIPLKKKSELRTQDSIDELVRSMTKQYATGSVEKETKLVPLKEALGSYASFTDASLVGKANAPGSYKNVTAGVIRYGSSIVNFTLLSNSLGSKLFKEALSIIILSDYHDVSAGSTTVVVPGEKWKIMFEAPSFVRTQSGPTKEGYAYRGSSKDGFNVSIFVEEKKGKGNGHKACADYYWRLAKRNPTIDQSTVATKKGKEFFKVSYRIRGEQRGIKFDVPNINLFFEYKGKWIDVHISKFPFKDSDQKVLDEFVKSLKYETASQQDASSEADKPRR